MADRVVLALPASAHGRPVHVQALAAVRREFPGCEVVGPERRWDMLLTAVAARSHVAGAHAFLFASFEGRVSRGVYEMARASREPPPLPGGALYFEEGAIFPEWSFEELPPSQRTRRHFAAVHAIGAPRHPPGN